MAVVLRKIMDSYNFVFYDLADERTKDSFPSGFVLLTVLPFYLYFCKSLGPRLMKNRKPFELKTLIFYYNIFQIFISAYTFYLGLSGGWLGHYNFKCQPVDLTDNYQSRMMLKAVWWYTTVKLIDLLDTVFFVLRKKDRQISFLHVFHHFMMPIASFIGLKYFPNGHATLLGVINCLVHVVMYTYYLLAGLGPRFQKYLWWKKHVTTMQLVQFVIIFFHSLVAFCNKDCGYPRWITFLLSIHSIQFIYMFGSFYYENYIKKPKAKTNGTHSSDRNNKATSNSKKER